MAEEKKIIGSIALTNPTCDECGKPALKIVERVLLMAYIQQVEDGSFNYTGESDVNWNDQEPDTDSDGLVNVQCEDGHYWITEIGGEA